MTEEQITKAILTWLERVGWNIVCYDFPQSGTGVSLHPNFSTGVTKNRGAIIPDIVAIKSEKVIFFENKDHFVLSDLHKLSRLRESGEYSNAINKLLDGFKYEKIFYGIGIPLSDNSKRKIVEDIDKIDFAVLVSEDKLVSVQYQKESIFT